MDITKVTQTNASIYNLLIQYYEAEFSRITQKTPDPNGLFKLDTLLGERVIGFLCFINGAPAGLAAISEDMPGHFEMREFFVLPCFRNQATGTRLAHDIWSMFPGRWQIKQIEGAEYASDFWRKAIARFQHCSFTEDRYQDPYWGLVTRQSFTIEPAQHGEKLVDTE